MARIFFSFCSAAVLAAMILYLFLEGQDAAGGVLAIPQPEA